MSAMPATIPDALLAAAERDVGGLVFHLDDGPQRVSFPELAERARRGARRLTALGVRPGDTVGVLGPNRPEWAVWAFATWIAGAVLVPVQIPLRVRDPGAFKAQLENLVAASGCRVVLADPLLAGALPEGVGTPWHEDGDESGDEPEAPAPESPAVIQFTSGSTAEPKGALLTHAAVMAQMEILRHFRYSDGSARTALNWAPFFHDLGLFACVVHPATAGSVSHNLPTERFARDPGEWLRLIEAERAALTLGPSSAFASAIRAVRRRGGRVDLRSLDVVLFGAEVLDPDLARGIVEAAPEVGLAPEALGSTYGLAEAVLGVAYSPIGSGLRFDQVSLQRLAASGLAMPAGVEPSRATVSCGPPAPTMEVRIAAPGGDGLPERNVGEILVRGPSLMSGYVGARASDPFADGWLRTGDLGYLADGELHVTGRIRDMVIAMGHNYYPEDFEWAAGRVAGVRPGRCAAVADPHAEQVVLLVEPSDDRDPAALRREVRAAVADAIGVAPREVVVLPRGAVEKTTSGKLRRAAMRDAYAAGALAGQ